jgi:3-oxoacyl-[acyl-carrier-protein] synthase II
MSLAIAGIGWATPLGAGIDSVWDRLLNGEEASATTISEDFTDRVYQVFRVPESELKNIAYPRLRRASPISRFAASAGLQALESAGLKLDARAAERIALLFAVSNGGVIYTKRFYSEIVSTA